MASASIAHEGVLSNQRGGTPPSLVAIGDEPQIESQAAKSVSLLQLIPEVTSADVTVRVVERIELRKPPDADRRLEAMAIGRIPK